MIATFAKSRRSKYWRSKYWRRVGVATVALIASWAHAGAQPAQPTSGAAPSPWLDQGWGPQQIEWWRNVSQGSRLLPLEWLLALEQAGSTAMFLDPAFVRGFGYEPGLSGAPPVGFAIDMQPSSGLGRTAIRWRPNQSDAEPWVGMTCAACHTATIEFEGRRLVIEGGPTGADFQQFHRALDAALRETATDAARFDRFAKRVLDAQDGASARAMLTRALAGLVDWQTRVARQNETRVRYGPGRLDAVGHILNKVALAAGGAPAPVPSDAPVRYPVIWNAPQHDKLQWNGVAENSPHPIVLLGQQTDFGALGRNVGEVVGVFADVTPDAFAWNGFRSSVRLRELIEIERLLGSLKSPAWPGRLDAAQVESGRMIYLREKCDDCHALLPREDLAQPIKARMTPLKQIGTDIWMACNAFLYVAPAGTLTGVRKNIYSGPPIQPDEHGLNLLTATVTGTIVGKAGDIVESILEDVFRAPAPMAWMRSIDPRFTPERGFPDDSRKREMATKCTSATNDYLAYKARPLNGVWASAPYLHNGSVPTLYDLFLPARLAPLTDRRAAAADAAGEHRPDSFFVGSRVFDPVKVGFLSGRDAPGATFEFTTTKDGFEVLGNSNAGHAYGLGLSVQERMALIEFLKSL